MVLKKVLNGAFIALLLGAGSACLSGCPMASTGTAPAAPEAPGSVTGPDHSVVQDQPSLPGGVVVMENDPHCKPVWEGEAEEGVLCRSADGSKSQVHLSGQLTLVHGKECALATMTLVVFNDGPTAQYLPINLDEEYRFDRTFEAQQPLSFRFGLREGGNLIGTRVGNNGILSMATCEGDSCSTMAPLALPMDLVQTSEDADIEVCPETAASQAGVIELAQPVQETTYQITGMQIGTSETQPSPETAPAQEIYRLSPSSDTTSTGVYRIVR